MFFEFCVSVFNLFFGHRACNSCHNCSLLRWRINLSSIKHYILYRFLSVFWKSFLDLLCYTISHPLISPSGSWLEEIKHCDNYTDHREVFFFDAWHCFFELFENFVGSSVPRDSNKYCVQWLVLKPVSDHNRVLVDIHSWSSPWSIAKEHFAIPISKLDFYKLSSEWLFGILCLLTWVRHFVEVGCLTSTYLAQENTCEIRVCFFWFVTFLFYHSVFCLFWLYAD